MEHLVQLTEFLTINPLTEINLQITLHNYKLGEGTLVFLQATH